MLNAAITGLCVSIGTYLMSKLIICNAKNDLFDYIESQEGLETLAKLGAAFAAGAMTQLKTGHVATGLKIGGLKIPQTVIDAVMAGLMQRFGLTQGLSEASTA